MTHAFSRGSAHNETKEFVHPSSHSPINKRPIEWYAFRILFFTFYGNRIVWSTELSHINISISLKDEYERLRYELWKTSKTFKLCIRIGHAHLIMNFIRMAISKVRTVNSLLRNCWLDDDWPSPTPGDRSHKIKWRNAGVQGGGRKMAWEARRSITSRSSHNQSSEKNQ